MFYHVVAANGMGVCNFNPNNFLNDGQIAYPKACTSPVLETIFNVHFEVVRFQTVAEKFSSSVVDIYLHVTSSGSLKSCSNMDLRKL